MPSASSAFGIPRNQGELRSPDHDIGPRAAFIRSGEQQSATVSQHTRNLLDQSALNFCIEQKEEPPDDHAFKSSGEKVRNFYSGTLHGNAWKTGPERCHDRG
jgi:hypothetical protein